jgi:PAS domain S-box-containing protein
MFYKNAIHPLRKKVMPHPLIHKSEFYDILIVDDNLSNLAVLNHILKEAGYRVRPASSGSMALKTVAAKLPSLILLDIKMPRMGGFEVCRCLKSNEHSRKVPVIFISSYGSTAKKVEGFMVGGIDYITKPFDPEEVLARIKIHLQLHELTERMDQKVRQRTAELKRVNEKLHKEITERKQAEEALLKSEEALTKSKDFLDKIINSIGDPIIVKDRKHRWVLINDALCHFMGRPRHMLVGKSDCDFFPKYQVDVIWEKDDLVLDTGEENINEEQLPNAQGVVSTVITKKTLYTDERGEPFIVGIMNDITERKNLEEQLRQALKMEAIGNLASGVAHDFNNILSSIIGFTELALDDSIPGSVQENNLKEVFTAGIRAKDLVKQILAFARQSSDEIKPVQVNLIVLEVLKLLRSTMPATIEIRQNIDSDSLTLGDPTQIHQIVMNLCGNAADAMNDKGILNVELTEVYLDNAFIESHPDLKTGDYLKLIVSDNGCGISPAIVDSIFEPYFTTKKTGEGTGMGLATTYGIVKQYNGAIILDTEENRGSTFIVLLPITKRRTRPKTHHPKVLPTGDERILFVDDEVSITKIGKKILTSFGYQVTVRNSSVGALELFRIKPNDFDLVITDMTMPNMTGDDLAVELIKIRRDIPIILCTGYSKKIIDKTASEIGIKAFAYKPIVKADLAKTIRKVLDETNS